MIPDRVERRARWVLDTIGARELGFGDDVPYSAEAWEQVERGERPQSDDLAEAFFHLARVEERNGARDEHDRFRAASSCLDPLDPPLERLRRRLGVEPPRWSGARFAVALTHDVDSRGSGRARASRELPRERRPTHSGPHGTGAARAARARRRHRAQGARHRSVLELRPDPRGRAALRCVVDVLPARRPRARVRRRRGRGVRAAAAAARRDAPGGARPRSGSTAATRPQTTPSGSPTRRSGSRRLSGPVRASATTISASIRTAISARSRPRASRTTRRSASATRSASGPESRIRSGRGTSSGTRRTI